MMKRARESRAGTLNSLNEHHNVTVGGGLEYLHCSPLQVVRGDYKGPLREMEARA